MKTPIKDFLEEYTSRGTARLHMPGHKGLFGHPHDITEIEGADVLYSPMGIIKESEEYASELFGTERTVYSTEGSSLSIKAMLALTVMYAAQRGERPLILAARNAHKTFIHAAALLDFDIEWIYGESLMSCKICVDTLRKHIESAKKKPTALYITSPDYLGNTNDIRALSNVAHEYGLLLLVDNAHGAYLKFLPVDMHPITLGADICCDSAHKTLPALTGAGYLHVSKSAPSVFKERIDEAMALFASTSPSYLILESLDLTNAYIADGYARKLENFASAAEKAKQKIKDAGFEIVGDEVLKITVMPKKQGYTGYDLQNILDSHGITAEFSDEDHLTLMLSPETDGVEMMRIADVITSLPKKAPIKESPPKPPLLVAEMTPREALLSSSELVIPEESVGRILCSASISCPPAVPIAMSGEIITKDALVAFKYYGIEKLRVIK